MEKNVLDSVDPQRLGRALQAARKRKGMTQEEAANVLDVARTTVVAIEQGERRIKAGELLKLAQVYGRQLSDLVAGASLVPMPQYRGPALETQQDREAIEPFIDEFDERCRQYLGLEQLTGMPLVRSYPRSYETKGLAVDTAAEGIAIQERSRLGLGDGPLPALRDLLEQDVGIRIFFLELPPRYSEMYWCTEELGACMAINRQHPEERRRWSMSHAYLHFLTSRYKAEVSLLDSYHRKPESERLADAFAQYFLMPTSGLTRRFADIKSASGKFTVSDLCSLAHYYGVSLEAFALRLEGMGLLDTGTWDELQAKGFKVREAQTQLGLVPLSGRDDRLPARFVTLAVEAYEQALITEGRFAHLLGKSIVEARELAQTLHPEDLPTDDIQVAALTISGSESH
jgi:Zn-dependent peptidase ImmA (M78 family)/DNA-binding XRE family transcriptional regulator